MRDTGLLEEDLFFFLNSKKKEDLGYRNVLSSMCTIPHPVAVRAHTLFIEANLGDPGLFQGTSSLEKLLIKNLGELFGHPGADGYATSGGTESNIQALRIAKKMHPVESPNVVAPESAHFSFEKACDLLAMELRTAPCDKEYRVNPEGVEACIDKNTVAIVGVAGTTEYGMVDPIPHLSDIAEDHGILLHVDAAFGGLVLPFLENPLPFDFTLPGVGTISADPHKMGLSTIPAGCLLVREGEMFDLLNVDTPYLTVKKEHTLSGTRSGGAVAGAFAVMEYLGRSGMQSIVRGCMKNTRRLIDGMETFGFPAAVIPDVNVATFTCPKDPSGWHISRTRRGHMRIVCMPHVHRTIIEAFLRDIGTMYAEAAP
jgi:tyrosine decarboxylase/aspartate 1-decarboxylase